MDKPFIYRVHTFENSGDAYDRCQWDEKHISYGDILIIPSERIVGIADTWPIAVTQERGQLHTLKPEVTFLTYNEGTLQESAKEAEYIARGAGYLLPEDNSGDNVNLGLMININKVRNEAPTVYRDFEGLTSTCEFLEVCEVPSCARGQVPGQGKVRYVWETWWDEETPEELREAHRSIVLNYVHEQFDQAEGCDSSYVYKLCHIVWEMLTVQFWTRVTEEELRNAKAD